MEIAVCSPWGFQPAASFPRLQAPWDMLPRMGSEFNRDRRCRWVFMYASDPVGALLDRSARLRPASNKRLREHQGEHDGVWKKLAADRRKESRARKRAEREEREKVEALLDELDSDTESVCPQGEQQSVQQQQNMHQEQRLQQGEQESHLLSTSRKSHEKPNKNGQTPRAKKRKAPSDSTKRGQSLKDIWGMRRRTVDEELNE